EILNRENTEKLSALKYIFLAGEALLPELVNKFRRLNTNVLLENIYGPTEAAVYASKYSLSQWQDRVHIPIGTPIQNIRLSILDRYDRLQPIGITGELCIAGSGVGRGYLNRPELTAEKFDQDLWDYQDYHDEDQKLLRGRPDASRGGFLEKSPPGRRRQKIYRTGDLSRWLPDGNVEFLGRRDHQVKIRGFRIELGEIENRLSNYQEIKDVVVVDKADEKGDKYLCAYFVLNPARAFNKTASVVAALREYLSKELPAYMIPSHFVQLEELPLTTSGKVNRKALPEPEPEAKEEEYAVPVDEMEETLVELFRGVLGVDKVGRNSDFFSLGGHSLKATILVSRIGKAFNVDFPLNKLFKVSTVKGIAKYINKCRKCLYKDITIVEKKEYYPLSSAQKRLFFLDRFEDIGTSYNMPSVIRLEERPDPERYEKVFRALIVRHETLRASFEYINDIPMQRIHDQVDLKIEYFDAVDSGKEPWINYLIRPFDLSKAPLLRVGFVQLRGNDFILFFDMHHIISDGTSMGNLVRDFEGFYNGEKLPLLKLQYKDFAVWQNNLLAGGVIKDQEDYWL
nr:AMP-binding protein [Candidatus Aminicenantes bacterium]NIO22264.1 AMP-binding protein [Candidatus Aenigmarchaeota archaeon]NIM82698.1 AMP-binding protein [Candidatus Aminicenantes bacterium]NIN22069.1 AMP-binding protein [Candidatus Aminicenantes bacterium]NIN45828.1 AMP-binding protein [Candidatus Aminicenantes bacterium]